MDEKAELLNEQKEKQPDGLAAVSEAIKYRKRAQAAEKRLQEMEQKFDDNEKSNQQLSKQLENFKVERELINKLVAEGAHDLESALLTAKVRMNGKENDIDEVVSELKKDKSHLFREASRQNTMLRTAGAKDKKPGGQRILDDFAEKAAKSGNRTDVHEYLRIRRQFV